MWSSKPPEFLVGFLNVQAADQLDEAGTLEICNICPNAFDLSQLKVTIMVGFWHNMTQRCTNWWSQHVQIGSYFSLWISWRMNLSWLVLFSWMKPWKWLSNTKLAIITRTIATIAIVSFGVWIMDPGAPKVLMLQPLGPRLEMDMSWCHGRALPWCPTTFLSWFCHHCICCGFRTCGSAGHVPSRTSAPLPLYRPCHVPRILQYSISRAWSTWEAAKQRGQMDQPYEPCEWQRHWCRHHA